MSKRPVKSKQPPSGGAGRQRPAFASLLAAAIDRRRTLLSASTTDAVRLFGGEADGLDGVYVDRYGPGCVLILYQGRVPGDFPVMRAARDALELTADLGVRAVYLKPFARDRSSLGGQMPAVLTDPTPAVGDRLDEFFLITEHGCRLEVRLYDGYSTGLFLDQRENRRFLAQRVAARVKRGEEARVLNTFAYTGAFSVHCALAGAATTTVDISARYLDWAKRNFTHNGVDPAAHRFAKMDTFEFFRYAKRKQLAYDLVILDPPSFAAANKKRGIPAWSSTEHYARLVYEASQLVAPGGVIFASTNTADLCRPGRLEREIEQGLGHRPQYIPLPPIPEDFAAERERFAAKMVVVEE
ncbi:MAG: hypothetical protein AMXMBFR58_01320 [Phycisphaerae bacterium]